MSEPLPMRSTVDTYSGKRFRWNAVDHCGGLNVPAHYTNRTHTYLHPTRVVSVLLQELNPGVNIRAILRGHYGGQS